MRLTNRQSQTRRAQHSRGGSAIVEFTLVAIPLLFLILFAFEFGRAIWSYHTLAGAVKIATRYMIVRGARCSEVSASCSPTVNDVAWRIRYAGRGLDPSAIKVTLQSGSKTHSCTPLTTCLGDSSPWPPPGDNAVGLPVLIEAAYDYQSALTFFWPGQSDAAFTLVASSRETIQF